MLTLARSEADIPILPESLDSHPWLLNCVNGTLDLQTGKLLPHDRQNYLTKLVPHDFILGAEAESPLWDEFLATIFADNWNMVRFLQRLFGSALVGQVIEHVLPILWGKGANGKSVLVETMLHVFGPDYGCKAASDLLLAKRSDSHPTERGRVARQAISAACSRRTDENPPAGGRIGQGIDRRRHHQGPPDARRFLVIQAAAHCVAGLESQARGPRHRQRYLATAAPCAVHRHDPTGAARQAIDRAWLHPISSGILRWCVEGCLAWQHAEGLGEPDEVIAATADYRDAMDVLAAFHRRLLHR